MTERGRDRERDRERERERERERVRKPPVREKSRGCLREVWTRTATVRARRTTARISGL